MDDETIECLIEDIRTSGATDQALEQANQFISTAKKLLMDMPSNPEREGLYELADYVVQRTI